jgi:ABC-type phosphate transport system substrate-binding protein
MRARWLRLRYALYAAVVLALLLFRTIPSLRSHGPASRGLPAAAKGELVLAGFDNAPELITRVVAYYQSLYPKTVLRTIPGGTVQAIEDILNHRADVAFLSRPLLAVEDSVVRAAGDSLQVFAVAVAGTLVLAGSGTTFDSLSVGALRQLLRGRQPAARELQTSGLLRVYVPDPRTGLWDAITRQLEIPADTAGANVAWVADDRAVAQALAADPAAIGIASSLALGEADVKTCRTIRITGDRETAASDPTLDQIAGGAYPLYHELYASCRERPGADAAAFTSFLNGEMGQTLIRREGFLPAREIAREIQLAQRPVGMPR